MMTITVYVGDVTEDLANEAKKHNSNACFVTSKNFLNLTPGTYYTSIGDLDELTHFANIMQQANIIVYVEPSNWSDKNIKSWTEDYLKSFSFLPDKVIYNFTVNENATKTEILKLSSSRQTDSNQIWISGCSISHGVGVPDNQRYGELISNQIKLPVSFLTAPGSSIKWQSDQILRSDLRKNDLLIWGLTCINRTVIWEDSKLRHLNTGSATTKKELELLCCEQLLYDAVTAIHQVINFCNKVGCKLILASLLAKDIEEYLHDCKFFIGLCDHFGRNPDDLDIDRGTDNQHPGPIMHQYYANQIIKKYNSIYGDNT